jgi:hypothetical protein
MRRLRLALVGHLQSTHVGRVVYGAIIGLALVVALQAHPPGSGTVVALIIGTAVAVGLAELYSEVLGTETRNRRRARHEEVVERRDDSVAVAFGTAFPAVFFILALADVIDDDTAFNLAKWTGLGLISFYGYCAGRLAGAGNGRALVQAFAVGLVAGALIALKAFLH